MTQWIQSGHFYRSQVTKKRRHHDCPVNCMVNIQLGRRWCLSSLLLLFKSSFCAFCFRGGCVFIIQIEIPENYNFNVSNTCGCTLYTLLVILLSGDHRLVDGSKKFNCTTCVSANRFSDSAACILSTLTYYLT